MNRLSIILFTFLLGGCAEINAAQNNILEMWRMYAGAATRNYKPQFLAKNRTIDWVHLTNDVAKDIEMAKENRR